MTSSKPCTSSDAATFRCRPNAKFEPEDAYYLEKELPFWKKVSLIFMLHGKSMPTYALQILNVNLLQVATSENTNHIFDWITKHKDQSRNWLDELTEALSILKLNAITRRMGCYSTQNIRERFLPHISGAGIFVHPILKELYFLCEYLQPSEAADLVQYVQKQYPEKQLKAYESKYLEINLLEWMSNNVINIGDWDEQSLTNCQLDVVFKWLESQSMFDKSKSLRSIVDRYEAPINNISNAIQDVKVTESEDDLDVYRLQPHSIGYLVIFNQVEFQKSKDKKQEELKTRNGSDADKKRLIETFSPFGYKIKEFDNLKRAQIFFEMKKAALESGSKDSIIVCFLSHGGVEFVYSSDSVPIQINELERLLLVDELIGKPKVLIIQACQGKELMVVKRSSLETDGPTVAAPLYTDMCVFHATIPGFVSFRDRFQGTWFIQSLCDQINKFYKKMHLNDIFTKVVQDVSAKREHDKALNCTVTMTPNCQKNTFTKKFHFPRV